MKLFDKLFGGKLQRGKLIISIIGFVIGLSLVSISSEVYLKVNDILGSKQTSNYLILNKKVSLLSNTLLNRKTTFSEKEVAFLKTQSFVRDVSPVTSSGYKITVLEVDIPGAGNRRFYSDFFLESVPSSFIDVRTSEFEWKEGDETIPIIIPRDYIHLYNFGFAPSQGTPQVPGSMVKHLTGKIRIIDHQGKKHFFKGKIVGLSDRIPTIIAPKSFNDFANSHFADPNEEQETSRVLVEVNNPSDPDLIELLKTKHYQTNNDKLNSGKAALVVSVIMLVLLIFGLCFIILSIVNVILSFSLVISESRHEVRLLLELGYTTKMIAKYMMRYLFIISGIETILVFGIFFTFNTLFNNYLTTMGYDIAATVRILPLLLILCLVILNIGLFWRELNKVLKK